jgi:hypothetical protein
MSTFVVVGFVREELLQIGGQTMPCLGVDGGVGSIVKTFVKKKLIMGMRSFLVVMFARENFRGYHNL